MLAEGTARFEEAKQWLSMASRQVTPLRAEVNVLKGKSSCTAVNLIRVESRSRIFKADMDRIEEEVMAVDPTVGPVNRHVSCC